LCQKTLQGVKPGSSSKACNQQGNRNTEKGRWRPEKPKIGCLYLVTQTHSASVIIRIISTLSPAVGDCQLPVAGGGGSPGEEDHCCVRVCCLGGQRHCQKLHQRQTIENRNKEMNECLETLAKQSNNDTCTTHFMTYLRDKSHTRHPLVGTRPTILNRRGTHFALCSILMN
jgi:hypothetical protein